MLVQPSIIDQQKNTKHLHTFRDPVEQWNSTMAISHWSLLLCWISHLFHVISGFSNLYDLRLKDLFADEP